MQVCTLGHEWAPHPKPWVLEGFRAHPCPHGTCPWPLLRTRPFVLDPLRVHSPCQSSHQAWGLHIYKASRPEDGAGARSQNVPVPAETIIIKGILPLQRGSPQYQLLTVPEHSPRGTLVGNVTGAVDADEGSNAIVYYFIAGEP